MKELIELKNIEQWENLRLSLMPENELVIFKYSPVCSISSMVEEDFSVWSTNIQGNNKIQFAKVNVIDQREVSRKIADDLKVQHQSPQVIWLKGRSNVKWTASHFDISKESLDKQLQ